MRQEFDLTVNRLPAKTWNWLKMNETRLEQISAPVWERLEIRSTGQAEFEIEEEKRRLIAQTKTGMGPELDELAAAGNIGVQEIFCPDGAELRVQVKIPGDAAAQCETADHERDRAVQAETTDREGDSRGLSRTVMSRLSVWAGAGSRVTVVMDLSEPGAKDVLSVLQTRIWAAPDAQVCLVQVQKTESKTAVWNDIGGRCEDRARIQIFQAILGEGQTYAGCRVELAGRESVWEENLGYLLNKHSRLDMNYCAVHLGQKTESAIDVSGVLRDRAFKLFRGTIDFQKGSGAAVGAEKEDVLLMDEGVVNQTIPLILCGEEDVQGSHGATIGRLDEELLFYMESRGLSRENAYEMAARARIEALCRKVPDQEAGQLILRCLGGEPDET